MSDDTRTYNSPLRDQRAAQTRERILDAAVKLLGEGAHRMTVPAVAEDAGVAVPTVYRYFGSKEELEEGVVEHVKELAGMRRPFEGVDGLVDNIRQNWQAADRYPPGTMPLLLASIARNLGQRDQTERREHVESCLGADLDALSAEDRERFVTFAQALASSPGGVAIMRTGLDASGSAELAGWALTTLHDSLRNRGDGD